MSVMSGSFHITGNTRDDQSQQSMLCFNKPWEWGQTIQKWGEKESTTGIYQHSTTVMVLIIL